MFRALLAHTQEALQQAALGTLRACFITLVQSTDKTRTQYTNPLVYRLLKLSN
jgi:hypothetical protein